MTKILDKKTSDDGRTEHILKKIGSHFVVIKSHYPVGATEADFAPTQIPFTVLEKAQDYFSKIQP